MARETGVERRLKLKREKIAELIAEAIKNGKYTQEKFARLVDMKVSYINRVLKGQANLTLQTICKFEDALGTDLITVVPRLGEPPVISGGNLLMPQ